MATKHTCDFCRADMDTIHGTISLAKKGEGNIKKDACKRCFGQVARLLSGLAEQDNGGAVVPMKRRARA